MTLSAVAPAVDTLSDAGATGRRVVVPELIALPRSHDGPIVRLGGDTMGTVWSVSLIASAGVPVGDLRRLVEAELDVVVAQMSTWRDDSDLVRFNHAPVGLDVALPGPLFAVLRHALAVARDSGGAYDPTVGPLVDAWGFGPAGRRNAPPAESVLAGARRRVGWQHVELDETRRRARKGHDVAIDLSAIAKGYAVDAVAAALSHTGIGSFLVDIGGELRGQGVKPDGQPWWVQLAQPSDLAPGSCLDTVVALHDLAIATSGDYLRSFDHAGVRYAHTIDPRTGRPVTHGVASVTVLHASCMAADALATALTVMTVDEAVAFSDARDLAALIVQRTPHGAVERITASLAALLD